MAKIKVAIFDHEGGWMLTNPDPKEYIDLPHVINPDLSEVGGVAPEDWVLVKGKIVPKEGVIARTTPSAELTKLLSAVSVMEKMRAEHDAASTKLRKLIVIQYIIVILSLLTSLITHLKG